MGLIGATFLWVGAYLLRASATMLLSVAMSATPGTTLSPITKAGVPRMLRASASFSPLRTDSLPFVSKIYWPENADDAIMDVP